MIVGRVIGWSTIVGRVIGWVLIAAALAFAGVEVFEWVDAGAYQGLALGQVWYRYDASSLNLAQAVVQRYLHPSLWDPPIITLLQWPGWLVAGVPGAALTVLFRRRRRGKRKRKRWFNRRRGARLSRGS